MSIINKTGMIFIDDTIMFVKPTLLTHTYGNPAVIACEIVADFTKIDSQLLEEYKRKNGLFGNEIQNVIFNDPATIVYWSDGSKTVVKCQPGDTFSEELGLAMAISKKFLGNKGNFNDVFKSFLTKNSNEKGAN